MKILHINLLNTKSTQLVSRPTFGQSASDAHLNIPKQDEFVRNTGSLNIARLKNLDISHFRLADSNSVRGVTLAKQKTSLLTELKECGIETIIDFRREGGDNSKYAEACRRNGLDYFHIKIDKSVPIFNSPFAGKMNMDERMRTINEFVQKTLKFFNLMDKGKVYMACQLGLHRTDLAVTMNYLLNPKEPATPPTLSHMFFANETNLTNKYIGSVKNMLRNLNPEHKNFLGMPENFSDIFDARILKLRLMNRAK